MVGSPYQDIQCPIADFRFLQVLKPDMIGIGPYIKHADTPFATSENVTMKLTLRLISILRLMFPYALILAAQCRGCLERRVESTGYHIITSIGDVKNEKDTEQALRKVAIIRGQATVLYHEDIVDGGIIT